MADFVPGNIIQTPDFGQMAQGYLQQYRQEEAAKNKYLDQFEKAQGLYLEGDKPAVQEAWNKVQSAMDMVAESDTPEMRRKLREAYGEYGQVAGAAQALADQYRNEVAGYKADPTKYAVTGQEFLNSSEDYRLQRRSVNDIFAALDNPYTLARSMKYDLMNPYDQAKSLVSDSRMKLPDFYNQQGQLNKSALRDYAEKRARAQVNALPGNIEKAMAWGGVKEGYAGEDGVINTPEELEFIRSQDEDTRARFVDSYVEELTKNYMDLVASQLRPKGTGKGKKKLASAPMSIQAAGGEEVNFLALPEKVDGIVSVGVSPDGRYFVQEIRKEKQFDADKGEEVSVELEEYRPATQIELSRIISKYGNTYDLSALSRNFVPSQSGANQGFDLDEYFAEKEI